MPYPPTPDPEVLRRIAALVGDHPEAKPRTGVTASDPIRWEPRDDEPIYGAVVEAIGRVDTLGGVQ